MQAEGRGCQVNKNVNKKEIKMMHVKINTEKKLII